ncbi:tetratricopeptide repeat protein [Flavobacterium sp.]|uniref:tetratricopeptide repeat protein n=1 Tax=Flavobacterium sp. TaxID=239 RepID=UPI00286E7F10|nr:tetratricopeptide repeat protein [Flavobacterium sp.]
MNIITYTYLLNRPNAVNPLQVIAIEKILEDFPYFQSARSLHLKGLFKQDSFKYNQCLKTTAAHSTDRSVLFEFIISENFVGIQKGFYEEKEAKILDIQVIDSAVIKEIPNDNTLENSIVSSINVSNEGLVKPETPNIEDTKSVEEKEELPKTLEEKLELNKPLVFNTSETHSFQEWLQLSKIKPIIREENSPENKLPDNNLSTKLEIIDKFIEANPKIPPINKDVKTTEIAIKQEETSYLMTETLAKVYLEQKKYAKAIQAYEILILKYPEKSSYFAIRISDIKTLQQNNNS